LAAQAAVVEAPAEAEADPVSADAEALGNAWNSWVVRSRPAFFVKHGSKNKQTGWK